MDLIERQHIELVKDNLRNAMEQGYSFTGYTSEDIAIDLQCYSIDFEQWELKALVPIVARACEELGL